MWRPWRYVKPPGGFLTATRRLRAERCKDGGVRGFVRDERCIRTGGKVGQNLPYRGGLTILAALTVWLVWPISVAGQNAGAPTGSGRILGQVLEEEAGRPVPAAWVLVPILGRRTQTDPEGRFSLEGLPQEATLVLRVEAVGYQSGDHSVFLTDTLTTVTVSLAPAPLEIEGLEVSGERTYNATRLLERRVQPYGFGSTVSDQLDLLSSDASTMVDYLWKEARALLVRCPRDDHQAWEQSCMQFRSRRVPVQVCVDDMAAPGGPEMLYMYAPADLYRVEVLPDIRQVRLYTRAYISRLNRTGRVPPILPPSVGGCVGDE